MATVDPTSINFKNNGMYLRVLEMMGGNEDRAAAWWSTPNVNLGLKTPEELMATDNWSLVRDHLFHNKRNSGFDTNVGVVENFVADPRGEVVLTGFYDDGNIQSYAYDRSTRAAELYMKSLRTPIGSITKIYRANKGLNSGVMPHVTVVTPKIPV